MASPRHYIRYPNGAWFRQEDGAFVPADAGNKDRAQAITDAAGDPSCVADYVPPVVSKQALIEADIMAVITLPLIAQALHEVLTAVPAGSRVAIPALVAAVQQARANHP